MAWIYDGYPDVQVSDRDQFLARLRALVRVQQESPEYSADRLEHLALSICEMIDSDYKLIPRHGVRSRNIAGDLVENFNEVNWTWAEQKEALRR